MKKIILLLSLCASTAFAHDGLGNKMTQLTSKVQLGQKSITTANTNNIFSVTTTTEESGTIVHEYTDISGRIFAITWSGPVTPNLQNLLGNHFSAYKNPQNVVQNPGHSKLQVSNGDLVVENHGHMRAFAGSAYLKSAVPQGFDLNSLK